ncbi:YheC/YheD family protein [Anaerobacillus sp. MEB173]|uniref:YheC/YheD family endospore coat-associated protein n=1 Tax=Anaerobacillus sp. MEB173 TaxID=3383345 RepID=UPI003F933817
MLNKIILQPFDDEQFQHPYEVRINKKIYQNLQLNLHQSATLLCSNKEVTIECVPLESGTSYEVHCSKTLVEQLSLPVHPLPIKMFYHHENNVFEIGPIIATLTTIKQDRDPNSLFGPLTQFCEEMARYAHDQHSLFYVFCLKQWNKEEVTGYVWMNNQWIETIVPSPTVIYNRIGSRKLERSRTYQQFFEKCKELNIHYFNDHFLNKWEVFEALLPYEELLPYIPETTLLTNSDSLEYMLQNHPTVFLKPIHGSQGRSIFRITKHNDKFQVDYSTLTGDTVQTFSTIQQMFKQLRPRFQKQQFLIQQGIHLMDFQERSLDFRILCTRSYSGAWKVISSVARVSAKDKIVSNLAQGGELLKVEEVLSPIHDDKNVRHYKKFLQELAIEIVTLICQEVDGQYGEFGVDIGLDKASHPWLIEVNTKPSKNQDPEKDKETIRPSAKSIITYCHYLADF